MQRFMRSFVPGYLAWLMVHEGVRFEDDDTGGATTTELKESKKKKGGPGAAKQSKRKEDKEGVKKQDRTMADFFKSTKSNPLDPDSTTATVIPISETTPSSSTSPHISLVLEIHSSRTHFSTDSTPELRLSYLPSTIIPYRPLNFNLSRSNSPLSSAATTLTSPSKSIPPVSLSKRAAPPSQPSSDIDSDGNEPRVYNESKWSPDDVERIWIPEVSVLHAMPRWVARFDDQVDARKSPKKIKDAGKVKGGMKVGAMEQFLTGVRQTRP